MKYTLHICHTSYITSMICISVACHFAYLQTIYHFYRYKSYDMHKVKILHAKIQCDRPSKFSSPKADKNLKLSIAFLADIHNFPPAVLSSPGRLTKHMQTHSSVLKLNQQFLIGPTLQKHYLNKHSTLMQYLLHYVISRCMLWFVHSLLNNLFQYKAGLQGLFIKQQ